MNCKRICRRCLAALLVCCLLAGCCTVANAAEPPIRLEISSITAQPGQAIELAIRVTRNAAGLAGLKLDLTFDPDVLDVVMSDTDEPKPLYEQSGSFRFNVGLSRLSDDGDTITIGLAGIEDQQGTGDLLTLYFKVKADAPDGDYGFSLTADLCSISAKLAYETAVGDLKVRSVNLMEVTGAPLDAVPESGSYLAMIPYAAYNEGAEQAILAVYDVSGRMLAAYCSERVDAGFRIAASAVKGQARALVYFLDAENYPVCPPKSVDVS